MNFFRRLSRLLIEPHKSVDDYIEQRNEIWFNVVAWMFITVALVGSAIHILLSPDEFGFKEMSIRSIALMLLFAGYMISRFVNRKLGGTIIIILTEVAVLMESFRDIGILPYLIAPLILSSILFAPRILFALGFANIAGLLVISNFHPTLTIENLLTGFLPFYFSVFVLLLISLLQKIEVEEARKSLLKRKNKELREKIKLKRENEKVMTDHICELEIFKSAAVDRELRMIELKKEIEKLRKKIRS